MNENPGWNFDMKVAPRDNTLLQLLIRQDEDHSCGFDDASVTRTMGFNNFDNDTVDEWKFPGWSWTHDCIIEQGHGTPVAWAPMLPLPPEVASDFVDNSTRMRPDGSRF